MGANEFMVVARGDHLREAFMKAVDEARVEYGRRGYTGSIAEKTDVVLVSTAPLSLKDAEEKAWRMLAEDDCRVRDKWGPAGVIPLVGGREWLIFGVASS